ncbi:MAG: hypothetical protein ACKVZH_22265 [Blastocatellia bacterium]
MSTNTSTKPSWQMPRRTFLANASLGMVAGYNQNLARKSPDKDDEVLDSLLALSRCELWNNKADLFIRAAIALQSAEAGDAQSAFYSFSKSFKNFPTADNFGLIALARMLFTKKTSEFRRARIGAPGFFGKTSFDDWPLDPIEIVDGVPFIVVNGYTLGGFPEPACWYIEYCIENCNWNNYKFTPKTNELKQAALDKLLVSPKWKSSLSEYDKKFLSAQIQ